MPLCKGDKTIDKIIRFRRLKAGCASQCSAKGISIQGYDNASTNVIAKEAGISKALMFHYVSSKQDLFLAVYDYFSDVMEKNISD